MFIPHGDCNKTVHTSGRYRRTARRNGKDFLTNGCVWFRCADENCHGGGSQIRWIHCGMCSRGIRSNHWSRHCDQNSTQCCHIFRSHRETPVSPSPAYIQPSPPPIQSTPPPAPLPQPTASPPQFTQTPAEMFEDLNDAKEADPELAKALEELFPDGVEIEDFDMEMFDEVASV